MDLIDRIKDMAGKIERTKDSLETEEATKNALIMPFISQILQYDVFDPMEVVPEFTADVGTKKGEKIDYAIKSDGEVSILIEAKRAGEQLTAKHASQLYRYFSVVHARIAILTNGIQYHFYTDLDAPNKMDDKPFLEIDLSDFDVSMVNELKKMTKANFDIDAVISSAGELKYTQNIKKLIAENYKEPTEDFVKLFAKQIHSGIVTKAVLEQFTDITKRAFEYFVNDKVSQRLQSALHGHSPNFDTSTENDSDESEENKVVTTEEEIEGYHIVKAIVRDCIDPQRVVYRDTQSYFGVLIDDNNRKPLCRLHFNAAQKYIGLLDESRKETRHPMNDLNEIYNFSNELRERAIAFSQA